MLNRDQITAARAFKTKDVTVSEWGGDVRVRVLTGSERDFLMAGMAGDSAGAPADFRYRLIVATLIGDDGQRIFADDEIAIVRAMEDSALTKVFTASAELNGFGPAAVDTAEGNSAAATSGASTSDSPAASDAPSENSLSESTATS